MRVLVVGGGGREHALVWKLAQSPMNPKLHAAPGNPGIAEHAKCHAVSAEDIKGQVELAQHLKADLVVVGPEKPLAAGLVNLLTWEGILAFGPTAEAAELETSKLYAKNVMKQAGVATAGYRSYRKPGNAHYAYLSKANFPIVVKEDGLCQGKGATVCHSLDEAIQAIDKIKPEALFLIEEYLTGRECSMLAICDGDDFVLLPAIQDYKQVGVGDIGKNTGGMGAVTPVQGCDAAMKEQVENFIFRPVLDVMKQRRQPFKGVLYAGLMLTKDEPYVLEFNARFGDPETQVAMAMLDEDLLELLLASAHGELEDTRPAKWKSGACACVVAASGGYPGKYETGKIITGFEEAGSNGSLIFHAGTGKRNGNILTNGGRVLNAVATGLDLPQALDQAYHSLNKIDFEGKYWRSDIGCNAR